MREPGGDLEFNYERGIVEVGHSQSCFLGTFPALFWRSLPSRCL
jgi:hypothetical protein